jgi:hypothetical protein
MRKVKLFLEFVTSNTKSAFLTDLTYDEISKKLNCSIDEVEDFEAHLKASINPDQSFHGSLSPLGQDDESTIFDTIENEDQYLEMWDRFKTESNPSHSHSDDRL